MSEEFPEGVGVRFFAGTEKLLRRLHGRGKEVSVPIPMANEWIQALGKIERQYKEAVNATVPENPPQAR